MEVYSFDKELYQRIEEFSDILSGREDPTRASEIRSQWSSYLESNLEPTGWQAIYKIPKDCLDRYKILFPTTVVVMVNSIDWNDLSAEVEVIGIKDEKIQIPRIIEAKLIDLWPTKSQYYESINTKATANIIDQLRFFYYNVWMPWDEDIDDDTDWVYDCLESRIRMVYSLYNNVNSKESNYIFGLISEAKALQKTKNNLKEDLSDIEDEMDDSSSTQEYNSFLEIHLKIKCIQEEVQIFESFGKCSTICLNNNDSNIHPKIHFVIPETTIQDNLKHLLKLSEMYTHDIKINNVDNLKDALKEYKSGDTILLCPGIHVVDTEVKLVDNCKIQGLYNSNDAIIRLNTIESMLFCINGCAELQNLTLEGTFSLFAIGIKSGELTLKNCKLIGGKHGVMVYSKCQANLDSCVISNFDKGIIGNDHSIINLSNTEVRNCDVGADLYSTTCFTLFESKISDCNEHGLQIETNDMSMSSGDINILDGIENVDVRGSSISGNKKYNVVIKSVSVTDSELYEPSFNCNLSDISMEV